MDAISVVCRSFQPAGRFTQNLAEYLLPWFHWIHTTLLPYLCSMILTSSPATTSGFKPSRNASSLAHMIPSESIQLKSGSSHLFAPTLSPFASAATAALSAVTTASSAAVAGTLAHVPIRPAHAIPVAKRFLTKRFILPPWMGRCAHSITSADTGDDLFQPATPQC